MYLEKRGKNLQRMRYVGGEFGTKRVERNRENGPTSVNCNRIFPVAFPLMDLLSLSLLASSFQPIHHGDTRD